MTDPRPPEEMPSDWHVKTFTREQGFGTVARDGNEPVVFSIDVWDLGSWKPPKKAIYFAVDGAAPVELSPDQILMPQPGEPVRVQWKRSRVGHSVPALVQPTGRVSYDRKEYTLRAWISGIQKHAGRFAGVTVNELLRVIGALDADLADEWRDGESRDGSDYVTLLMSLAEAAEHDPAWGASHARWLYTDDHRWDRVRAQRTLGPVLGLREPCAPLGDGYATGTLESLPDYVARCNAAAEREGLALRWRELALDGDAHVLVSLDDAAYNALIRAGYVVVD